MKTIERAIVLPEGISAEIDGKTILLSAKGQQNKRLFHAEEIDFAKRDGKIVLSARKATKKINAVMNAIEAHVRNMVKGLEKEFEYKLSIVYSHFPMNVAVKGQFVEITNFAGEKKPRKARILGSTIVQVKGKEITVKGHDKEAAGQTAASIENIARVPKKDRRIFQDGIFLVSKPE